MSAGSLYGLPSLRQVPLTLHRNSHSDGVAIDRMAALLSQSLQLTRFPQPRGNARRSDENGVVNITAAGAEKHKSRSTMG